MKIGIVGNSSKDQLPQSVKTLIDLGKKYSVEYYLHRDLDKVFTALKGFSIPQDRFVDSNDLVRSSDVIVAFGGDGTMLSAARIVGNSGIPILGINLGKLGFLAESLIDELESCIDEITKQKFNVEERTLLRITVEGEPTELSALNEVVIDKSASSRVIRLSVYVNDDYLVSFPGDGLIISTPTGSTGYALAAGAPIVVPTTNAFVIQPISAHSLNARTVIIPDSSIVSIIIDDEKQEGRMTVDGQLVRNFKPTQKVFVQKENYTVKLVKRKDRSYYDTLRAKLLWGSDVRSVKRK